MIRKHAKNWWRIRTVPYVRSLPAFYSSARIFVYSTLHCGFYVQLISIQLIFHWIWMANDTLGRCKFCVNQWKNDILFQCLLSARLWLYCHLSSKTGCSLLCVRLFLLKMLFRYVMLKCIGDVEGTFSAEEQRRNSPGSVLSKLTEQTKLWKQS